MGSRRSVVTILTAMLLTAGCGADPGAAVSDTFTYALNSEPSCLDPQISPADATALITRGVVDSLVAQDASGDVKPWLATAWRISADLKTYTFTLRDGVTFHDGTPFDAAAVKANFDRIVAPDTKSQYASTLIGPYTGSTVHDPHTVEIHLGQPFQPFLQAVSTPFLGMESPKSFTGGASCGQVVGSGPFTFAEYIRQQHVELRRNPAYNWAPPTAAHSGAAHLQKVVIRFLPENATRLGALTGGQVDGIGAVPTPNVATVKADSALRFVHTNQPGAAYSVYLNTAAGAFTDVRVRRAFQHAIDIDLLVRSIHFGVYDRAWSMLSPNTRFYDKTLENSWSFDQAEANSLLDAAGWTARDSEGYRRRGGQRLSVHWPTSPQQDAADQRGLFGQGIQAAEKQVGIEVVRDSVPSGKLFELVAEGQYDISDMSWARSDPDILRGFLASTCMPMSGQNIARVADATVD